MPNTIKPKRKYTTGAPIASQLEQGELAINLFDKKIYSKDLSNNIVLIASANGSSTEKYKVANAVASDEAINKMQLEDALANLGNLSIFLNSKNTNGYQKLPNGLIIQWFGASLSAVSQGTFTFPISFPTSMLSIAITHNATTGQSNPIRYYNNTASSIEIVNEGINPTIARCIALGY